LTRVARGRDQNEIAADLVISAETVAAHSGPMLQPAVTAMISRPCAYSVAKPPGRAAQKERRPHGSSSRSEYVAKTLILFY